LSSNAQYFLALSRCVFLTISSSYSLVISVHSQIKHKEKKKENVYFICYDYERSSNKVTSAGFWNFLDKNEEKVLRLPIVEALF